MRGNSARAIGDQRSGGRHDQTKESKSSQKSGRDGLPEAVLKERSASWTAVKMPVALTKPVSRTYLDWIVMITWQSGGRTIDCRAPSHPRRYHAGWKRQGPHTRVNAVRKLNPSVGTHPVLRRAARRGQNVAGTLDRHVARPQVRAGVARRHARRSGDPRASPDVHRRTSRPGHPGASPRGNQEPGVHPGRDRQAGIGFPRRSGVGAARGTGPRTEQHVPR